MLRPLRLPAPLAVMALVFYLSAQPDLGTDLGWIDTVLRKGAHITIFAACFLAWAWALSLTPSGIVAAAAITIAYAVSDELHQSTVEGRHGAASDVAIDAFGVGVAVALLLWWLTRRRRAAATA